jgi:hypothetical protein
MPAVGPNSTNAGARIYFAYIDNAERMSTYMAAGTTSATRLSIVRGVRNVRNCMAWERFTYNVPLTWRRKVFDVNSSEPGAPGVDELERATQGLLVFAFETISEVTAGALGTFKVNSSTRLHNLELAPNT